MTADGLDPVIHAESRLRIVAALASLDPQDQVAFPRLQALLGMTAGNLSTHLRKLEDADYIEQEKAFRSRTPVTYVSLTTSGRHAFDTYSASLRTLLEGPGS